MVWTGQVQGALKLLLLVWLIVAPVLTRVRHPVPVLWMMPTGSGSGRENLTAGLVPAVRLALQDLQDQPEPLGNYEIQLQLLDCQCDPAEALRVLFDSMWAGPRYLLVFGGACPAVTALMARALPALSLVQVSFVAPPLSLSNRKRHTNLLSTVPSVRALNQAVVKLLHRYRWRRVGLITGDRPGLAEMKKDLIRQLLKADVQLAAAGSFSDDACGRLKELKDGDVRIIIGQFEDSSVSEVFCCAYRLNLFGPRYQWILAAEGSAEWRLGWQPSGCSATSLLTAADGSFRIQIRRFSTTNTPGASGRTPQDYQESYLKQLVQEGSEVNPLHAFAYDAAWVAGAALSQVMEAVRLREKYGAQVTVSEEEEVKMLLEAVKNIQFEGVTGPVSFRNGERMTTMELIQFQGNSGVLVGEFNTTTQQLRLMNHLLKFKGPGPAKDQTLVRLQHRPVSLFLYFIMSSAAAVIIFITLMVLCFVIINHRCWSGSFQDQFLLLGLLLCSSSVLLSGLDETSLSDEVLDVLCSARLWTLSVGHSVGFMVLFTRIWTLYSACSIEPKPIGCALIWVLLLDLLVLSSWQILDPLRRVVLHHSTEEYLDDQDVILRLFSERCSSNNMELWLTAVCGYRTPLLALGCFLAWTIRSWDLGPAGASGKLLPLSMLGVTAFSVSGVLASLLTSHDPPLQFCVSSILILSCNLFILGGLFGPQIFSVLWSRKELQEEAADEEEEEQLRRSNQELRSQGAQLDVLIETITMQLAEMFQDEAGGKPAEAGVQSVTHEAQICSPIQHLQRKTSSPDDINSPEQVGRRLSVQLPILHHSYLPLIGGISTSSSSQFSSQDVFFPHHDNFLYA
ncbi:gamma-aminobutyric acid type B receptor subunit 2 [Austrofundulus limnaeus]|uniref:Gamma-aminobutyric acid type B receptor subunit 2 n=1 Tax=Austrofundulus limnaeus TaxID=52670 RepID=A0A2I4CCD0_AUSLI|nr:PREDICTED: gamma-aminobutyric acid type B receptor subunit 2-like [Austrofundulus limnaeus]